MDLPIINFDHNATTALAPLALARMVEVYGESANASSVHALGRKAAMLVEEVRDDLRGALKAQNYEVFFTSGGTEANNMIIFSDDFAQILRGKIEHSSVYNLKPQDAEIIDLATNEDGVIDLQDLREKLKKISGKNFLVSLMLANNETGAIQPVKEAAQIVHQHGGLIHSDMVQAFGKIEIDLEDLNVDFASVSSHKINGPQGVGAVFVRKGIDMRPLIFGGGQEKGKRAGTLNIAAIAGFGIAIKLLPQRILKLQETQKIRDFIEDELKKIGGKNFRIFSQNVIRLGNTSFVAIKGGDAQTQLIHFDLNRIMVSSGSACSSGTVLESRILQAMNVAPEFLGAIRISLGLNNTLAEAEKFIASWKDFYFRVNKDFL
jgi:cysteine desulfurase